MRSRISSPAPAPSRPFDVGLRAWRLLVPWLLALTCAVFAGGAARAAGDRIDVEQAAFELRDDGYYFNGDFDFDLKPRVAEALDRGLTLYFVVEVELTRSRWYWFDEKAVNTSLNYRLSYHALTRQYRVASGNLQSSFATLGEAIGMMTHVRDWKVAERSTLRIGETYAAAVRMRLDTTQLPKPFQINAMTNRDWTLDSDWKRFGYEPR